MDAAERFVVARGGYVEQPPDLEYLPTATTLAQAVERELDAKPWAAGAVRGEVALAIDGAKTVESLNEEKIRALVKLGDRAPFGRGEKTLYDETVRRCTQIEAERVTVDGAGWRATCEGIRTTLDVRLTGSVHQPALGPLVSMSDLVCGLMDRVCCNPGGHRRSRGAPRRRCLASLPARSRRCGGPAGSGAARRGVSPSRHRPRCRKCSPTADSRMPPIRPHWSSTSSQRSPATSGSATRTTGGNTGFGVQAISPGDPGTKITAGSRCYPTCGTGCDSGVLPQIGLMTSLCVRFCTFRRLPRTKRC